ncbi:MAG: hypothetical protein HY784_15295, partial [Chloroflexi bacterium]|nr:hypothetical protein [Chloroflexota bacterium]
LTFALANVSLALLFRPAPLVAQWLTGAAAQVGYLDLALGGVLLVFTFVGQLAYAFVPILTRLGLEGRPAEAGRWLGRFMRYATLLCALAGGGMWLLAASLAPLLFGAQFGAAAATLRALAPGLLALPLVWAAGIGSAVEKTPGRMARAALAGLAVFLAAAWLLSRAGWPPGAAGVGAGFSLGLAGIALGTGRAGWRAARAGGRGWLIALGAAAPFGLAALWPGTGSGLGSGLLAWGAGAAGAGALALAGGAVSPSEIQRGLQLLTGLARSVIQFRRP